MIKDSDEVSEYTERRMTEIEEELGRPVGDLPSPSRLSDWKERPVAILGVVGFIVGLVLALIALLMVL